MDDQLGRAIILARAGDREAFGQLYEELAPRIFNYFYHHVGGHRLTAEDLCEDVFLNVLRGLDTYSDRSLPFSAWIFRVAHNRLVDHFRTQGRRNHLPLENAANASDAQPERELARVLDRDVLLTALARLSPDQRSVIVLRFLQHLSLSQAALALGKSEDGVKKLQQRALDSLRRSLTAARLRPAV